ncbi:unnamed protein product, partial [Choristocarpus tenellus]
RGARAQIALKYGMPPTTLDRLMRLASQPLHDGLEMGLASRRKGRPRQLPQVDIDAIEGVPVLERTSERKWAGMANVTKGKIRRYILETGVRPNQKVSKISLSDKQKIDRVAFIMSSILKNGTEHVLDPMFNRVHLHESWFDLVSDSVGVYLIPGEAPIHKSHIPKVMFLAVNARPRVLEDGSPWDGKIGIRSLTNGAARGQSSYHRPGDMMEIKTADMIGDLYEEMIEEKVLPAIVSHSCLLELDKIFLQDDQARPHSTSLDKTVDAWASAGGYSICVVKQPAQSPDFNALDLGFFRSLQTREGWIRSDNIDDLVKNVLKTYQEYDAETHGRVGQNLFTRYMTVLNHLGDNDFKEVPKKQEDRL